MFLNKKHSWSRAPGSRQGPTGADRSLSISGRTEVIAGGRMQRHPYTGMKDTTVQNGSLTFTLWGKLDRTHLCGLFPPQLRRVGGALASSPLQQADSSSRPQKGPSAAPAFSDHRRGGGAPRVYPRPLGCEAVHARSCWASTRPPEHVSPSLHLLSVRRPAVRRPWSTARPCALPQRVNDPCGHPVVRV